MLVLPLAFALLYSGNETPGITFADWDGSCSNPADGFRKNRGGATENSLNESQDESSRSLFFCHRGWQLAGLAGGRDLTVALATVSPRAELHGERTHWSPWKPGGGGGEGGLMANGVNSITRELHIEDTGRGVRNIHLDLR